MQSAFYAFFSSSTKFIVKCSRFHCGVITLATHMHTAHWVSVHRAAWNVEWENIYCGFLPAFYRCNSFRWNNGVVQCSAFLSLCVCLSLCSCFIFASAKSKSSTFVLFHAVISRFHSKLLFCHTQCTQCHRLKWPANNFAFYYYLKVKVGAWTWPHARIKMGKMHIKWNYYHHCRNHHSSKLKSE